jgi:hypothetical protein
MTAKYAKMDTASLRQGLALLERMGGLTVIPTTLAIRAG